MNEKNGHEQTKRGAANRAIADRSASDQIGEKSREVAKDLQEIGEITMDAAQEKIGQLRDSATECLQQGKDSVLHVEQSFEQYIRDRPLKSILIAAGVGMLFGRFWLRR